MEWHPPLNGSIPRSSAPPVVSRRALLGVDVQLSDAPVPASHDDGRGSGTLPTSRVRPLWAGPPQRDTRRAAGQCASVCRCGDRAAATWSTLGCVWGGARAGDASIAQATPAQRRRGGRSRRSGGSAPSANTERAPPRRTQILQAPMIWPRRPWQCQRQGPVLQATHP